MLRKKIVLLIPAVLLLVQWSGVTAFRFRGSGARSDINNRQQYLNNYYKSSSSNIAGVPGQGSAHLSEQKPVSDGTKGSRGLSAWGIIAIIVGVILLGTGGYYAFVFYPYVCKKERNYDMIELTNVL